MGVAAREREAADDGHAAGPEHNGLGQTHALTIALEAAGDADALGMIAPEARVDAAAHLLEPVDHPRLGEATRREPAGHISKAARDGQNGNAYDRQSRKITFVGQR